MIVKHSKYVQFGRSARSNRPIRRLWKHIEELAASPGETWDIVTAIESTVRLAIAEIDKDITRILKIRSSEILIGKVVDEFPVLSPARGRFFLAKVSGGAQANTVNS